MFPDQAYNKITNVASKLYLSYITTHYTVQIPELHKIITKNEIP